MEFKLSITNPFKIERKGYYHVLEDKWSKRVLSDIYDFLHFRQKDYGRTSKQIESYQVNALVYTIVNKLTSNTASLPVKAVNDKGEIIENSKLLEVLKKPNEYQSRIEWNQNSLEYLALSGNVFIRYIEGIGAGYELEVLDSANVRILINSYGDLTGYEYTDNAGLRIRLDIEEVLHIKLSSKLTTNLDNKYWGLSPLSALWDVVQSSNDLFAARSSIWKNKGIIGILTNKSDTPLLPKERKEIQDKFDKDTGGARNANKMHITSTNVDFIQTSMSPTDLKLMEGNIDNLRLISAAYKMPSVLFNDVENSTYNNVLESKKDAYTDAYIPLATKFYEKLSQWLSEKLSIDEKIVVDITRIEILKSMTNEIATNLNNLPTNVAARVLEAMTKNEARDLIGLEEIEGGSEMLGKSSNSKEDGKQQQ